MAKKQRSSGQLIRTAGGWKARVTITDPLTGKRRAPSKTFRTKAEAERWQAEQRVEVARGTYVRPSTERLSDYLESWLSTVKPGLAPRTWRDYRKVFNAYVIPRLGAVRLVNLRAEQIQHMYAELQERGISQRKQHAGLAPRSIALIHAPLRAAMKQAVAWGKIARSPCDGVKLPRVRRTEKRALSLDEVKRFREAAAAAPLEALWLFLLDSGARPGEALGLRWGDLDFEAGTVTIRGAATLDHEGRTVLSEHPKTARSRRTLTLHENTLEALVRHRAAQAKHALEKGRLFDRSLGLVFPNVAGELFHDSNLRRDHWYPLLEAAELGSDLTPYVLRHTMATLALKAGVPVLVVAERLGHANPTMVLTTYGHTMEGQQAEAAAKLGGVIYGSER